MVNNNRIAQRHPSVLIVTNDEENIQGVANIIAEQTKDFSCLAIKKTALKDIEQLSPKVILFALSEVKKSICLYNQLIKENKLDKNHYSVLLCNNKESGLAFKCCLKNLFDNYFVFQPLYEKFRLQLVIYEGLKQVNSSNDYIESLDNIVQSQHGELNNLIELGLSYKSSVLEEINKTRDETTQAKTQLLQQLPEGEYKQLLTELSENSVQKLISTIENSLLERLVCVVDGLKHSQSLNESLLEKLKQPVREQRICDEDIESHLLTPQHNPQSILLVEDNHIYREMICDVLSTEGFDVEQVDDGLAAIKKIKFTRYDLIMMDLFLPNLDGLNTTKHIRNVGKNLKTPVIALTGNKNKQLVKRWASHGLDGYILKPSTKSEILTVINKVLQA